MFILGSVATTGDLLLDSDTDEPPPKEDIEKLNRSRNSKTDSFVHLHTHTEYSLLDGAARVYELVRTAAADGQPAVGITDHGNMYGAIDFYRTCKSNDVKPIIGTEAYMALESRHERPSRRSNKIDDTGGEDAGGHKLYYHLTLLAENNAGYRNLLKLSSRAFLEGFYYKPRMDWEMFEEHSEGLIATTGCLGSVVQQALLNGDYDAALRRAARLQDIFGRESLYVELQDHGIPAQHDCNPSLLRIAKEIGAPLLATNDLHYTHQHDATAHDALLCVQVKEVLSNPSRFKFHGDQHYLKSAAEMRALFSDHPDACDNTLAIAERAEVELDFGQIRLPNFPVPDGHDDADAYLAHLTLEGAHRRWGDPLSADAAERIAYELRVIADMGFSAYFLITWDLIRHAKEQGIRVGPGRGSAAGCAVAYSLGITDLDPLRYGLLFERFLNPSRVSMPDIDIDFDDRYRDQMIRYAADKYGRDHVAQVITFSMIKARAAVRDAARILEKPPSFGDRLAKAVPPFLSLETCVTDDPIPDLGQREAQALTSVREAYRVDPQVKRVIDTGIGLEGLIRQDSIHAAAVVISPEPLTEIVPIQRKPEKDVPIELSPIVTQYDMHGVEMLGLLKMDFLGLRTLSVIEEASRLVRESHDAEFDIDSIPLDDPATLEMLCAGDALGVFQIESDPMRELMRELVPTTFEDVCALVALYRPGPMAANMHHDYASRKNGRSPAEPPHPDLAELLEETYGLMIYQESMMRVAQQIAGYSMADADDLRKACGKKQRDRIASHRRKFIDGSVAQGYDAEFGEQIFDIIEPFADYAFNKSHAFGYGLITWQTAFLKANWPAEFYAATLTGSKRNLDKAGVYLTDCRMHEIEVIQPDVNRSDVDFSVEGSTIVFGLSAIRHVGDQAAVGIVAERRDNGPYQDFTDFCERVPRQFVNKRAAESLVKSGAFESCGHPRGGLLDVYGQVLTSAHRRANEAEAGMQSMFGEAEAAAANRIEVPDEEADEGTRLQWERELLGLYISGHPLNRYEGVLANATDCQIADLEDIAAASFVSGRSREDEQVLTIGGIIRDKRTRYTRHDDLMATFALADLHDSVQVTVFPSLLERCESLIENNQVVLVTGRIEHPPDREPSFVATAVTTLPEPDDEPREDPPMPTARITDEARSDDLPAAEGAAETLILDLGDIDPTPAWLDRFSRVLADHPGDDEVRVRVGNQAVVLPMRVASAEAAEPLNALFSG